MATDQQITANRANALHSTGPRTDAGKSASSKNATRHSLTSKGLIIVPGQEETLAELESGLRSKLVPKGPLEEVLFKRALECAWNLERCRQAESNLHADGAQPGIDPLVSTFCQTHYERIHRYARESENSMYKAMRELGKLQAEAQFRQEICPLTVDQPTAGTPHSLSQVCLLSQVMKHVITFHKNENKTAGIPAAFDEYESRIEADPQPAPELARAA